MRETETIFVNLHKDSVKRLKDELIPEYNLFDVVSIWLEKKIKNETRESLLSVLTSEEIKEIRFVFFDGLS